MAAKKLIPKQLQFCKEYIIDLNATQAAIRAGYSKKTARQKAHNLFTIVYIHDEIERLVEARSKRTEITADRVLQELAAISFIDFKDMFDENGNMLEIHKMPENIRRSIGGITVTSTANGKGIDKVFWETKNIKIIDKKGTLELIGRHLAMFKDNLNLNQSNAPYNEWLNKTKDAK